MNKSHEIMSKHLLAIRLLVFCSFCLLIMVGTTIIVPSIQAEEGDAVSGSETIINKEVNEGETLSLVVENKSTQLLAYSVIITDVTAVEGVDFSIDTKKGVVSIGETTNVVITSLDSNNYEMVDRSFNMIIKYQYQGDEIGETVEENYKVTIISKELTELLPNDFILSSESSYRYIYDQTDTVHDGNDVELSQYAYFNTIGDLSVELDYYIKIKFDASVNIYGKLDHDGVFTDYSINRDFFYASEVKFNHIISEIPYPDSIEPNTNLRLEYGASGDGKDEWELFSRTISVNYEDSEVPYIKEISGTEYKPVLGDYFITIEYNEIVLVGEETPEININVTDENGVTSQDIATYYEGNGTERLVYKYSVDKKLADIEITSLGNVVNGSIKDTSGNVSLNSFEQGITSISRIESDIHIRYNEFNMSYYDVLSQMVDIDCGGYSECLQDVVIYDDSHQLVEALDLSRNTAFNEYQFKLGVEQIFVKSINLIVENTMIGFTQDRILTSIDGDGLDISTYIAYLYKGDDFINLSDEDLIFTAYNIDYSTTRIQNIVLRVSYQNIITNFVIQVETIDIVSPVVIETSPLTVKVGATYGDIIDEIKTWFYDSSGISSIILNSGDLTSTDKFEDVGNISVSIIAVDGNGLHSEEETISIKVIDDVKPVIVLRGEAVIELEFGETYTDLGVTCNDNNDENPLVNATSIELDELGFKTIEYYCTDSSGNQSKTVTRTINVVDTTNPTITILQTGIIKVNVSEEILYDSFYSYTDNFDKNCIVTISGKPNVSKLGVYIITVKVEDSSGNASSRQFEIEILDDLPPIIVYNDTIIVDDINDLDVLSLLEITDNFSTLDKITVTLETSKSDIIRTGKFAVTVSDELGNEVKEEYTITIIDLTPPVITIKGTLETDTTIEEFKKMISITDNFLIDSDPVYHVEKDDKGNIISIKVVAKDCFDNESEKSFSFPTSSLVENIKNTGCDGNLSNSLSGAVITSFMGIVVFIIIRRKGE